MGDSRHEQNRSRYKTVAFRMSEQEFKELNTRIELSGRDKQDYFIKSTLYQTIVVIGNRVQFETLNNQLYEIGEHLRCLERASDFDLDMLTPIRSAIEILSGFTDAEKPWDDNGMTFTSESCDSREKSKNSATRNRW